MGHTWKHGHISHPNDNTAFSPQLGHFFLVCLKTVKQVGDNKLGVVVYIPVVISGGDHMYTFFENMSIQVFCPFEWD